VEVVVDAIIDVRCLLPGGSEAVGSVGGVSEYRV